MAIKQKGSEYPIYLKPCVVLLNKYSFFVCGFPIKDICYDSVFVGGLERLRENKWKQEKRSLHSVLLFLHIIITMINTTFSINKSMFEIWFGGSNKTNGLFVKMLNFSLVKTTLKGANCLLNRIIISDFFFKVLTWVPALPLAAPAWFRWACRSSLQPSGCEHWRSPPRGQRSWWTGATPAGRWPGSWGRHTDPPPFWNRSSPAAAPAPWTAASQSENKESRLEPLWHNLQNELHHWIMNQTYPPVSDCLKVTNETQQTFTNIQNHRTDHPHPGLKRDKTTINDSLIYSSRDKLFPG